MATRAPKGTQTADRPKRGRAQAAPRGRQAKKDSRTAKSGRQDKRKNRYSRSRRRQDKPRGVLPSVSAHPLLILLGWGANAVAGLWMLLAHGAGAVARGIGRSARGLEPAHRRDGIGLAAIGAAIVVAGTALWPTDNAASRLMTPVVRGAFGSLTWVVPVLLALLGWRFLRHPDRNAETGRMVIGWLALIIGVLGLVHIANGTPRPSDGARAIQDAGGLIGFAASAPLVAALTPWLAALLLALIAGFGVLVITATPLHAVPRRLATLLGLPGRAGRRVPPRPGKPVIPNGREPDRWPASAGASRPSRLATTSGHTTHRSWPIAAPGSSRAPRAARRASQRDPVVRRPTATTNCSTRSGSGPGRGRSRTGWTPGRGPAASARRPAPGRPRRGPGTTTACCAGPSSSPSPARPTPATPCRPRRCCVPGPYRRPGPAPTTS